MPRQHEGNQSMNRTENTKARIIITILLGIAAVFLYFFALDKIQYRNGRYRIQTEMAQAVKNLEKTKKESRESFDSMEFSMSLLYMQDARTLGTFAQLDPGFEISDDYLSMINQTLSVEDIMITDREGKVLASATGSRDHLSNEVFEPLWETFETGEVSWMEPVPDESEDQAEYDGIDAYCEWYSLAYDKDHAIVLKVFNVIRTVFLSEDSIWTDLLGHETIGQMGYLFVWSDKTKSLLYYPDNTSNEALVEELGIHLDEIKDGGYVWQNINGEKMYLHTSFLKEDGVWVACAIPEKELEESSLFNKYVMSIAFALLCAALVYYVVLLLRQKKVRILSDFTGSGKKTVHRSRKYKLLILTIVMIVMLFLFHFYLQTLYLMSTWAEAASRYTEKIEKNVAYETEAAASYITVYDREKKSQLGLFTHLLSVNPDLYTSAWLDEVSYDVNATELQILDTEGNCKVASSAMAYQIFVPEKAGDNTTVNVAEETARQDEGRETVDWIRDGRRVILPIAGSDGNNSGYLYVWYFDPSVDEALQRFSLAGILGRVLPGSGGFVFSIDSETKKFSYYPDEDMTGRDALEYGLTENQIRDNYCDFVTINGKTYYVVTDAIGINIIYFAISKSNLLNQRFPVCVAAAILGAILLFLAGMALYTSREQIEIVQPDEGRHTVKEDQNSPEYRTLRVLEYYAVIAAALFAAYSTFRGNGGSGGVLGYVLDGRWERGINVFALSSAAIIMSKGAIIVFLFSRLVRAVSDILPIRGGTILRMVGSLVTYVAIAFLIYRCMICFGLNPTALMASAGIVSVVLGIGANSLVGDILAGIFLLMEGNVQVGDVVQVGDFRGYVMELGIRMTKLFDMDTDDVKIIPNNEVRNVVHMTMRSAIVYSDFQIRYEERLESVEKILREELKNVPDKSPLILDGPTYIGVRSLDENGVVLRMASRCHEPCRRKVEREVNRIVYRIFQKNNISVPYPQVTFHQGDDNLVER